MHVAGRSTSQAEHPRNPGTNPSARPRQCTAHTFQSGTTSSVPDASANDGPFTELLADLLPEAEKEISGGLFGGASDDYCEPDGEVKEDKSNNGLVAPPILQLPAAEPQTIIPWFGGLDLSLLTQTVETENESGTGTSGHMAALSTVLMPAEATPHASPEAAPIIPVPLPQERAESLSPRLHDFLRQSQTSQVDGHLQTSFAARLIAKTPDGSVVATRNSTEVSPVSAASEAPAAEPVRFGTADSPVLGDTRHGAGGEREPNKEAGSGIKHAKPETPVAGELHSSQSVTTILNSATPAAESVRVTEARSDQASATQQQAPATTTLREAAPITDPPSTEPLRDLAIDVPAPTGAESNGRIQLQLTDRAGELRVRVRTSDSALSSLLQRDLGDLVSRLEDSGFDAQTWTPDSTKGIAETTDSRMGSQREDNRDHDNGSGNHSQHSRDDREDRAQTEDRGQRHDRNRAPSWVEAWDRISADGAWILRQR